jgi:hypothetical protein
MNIMWPETKNDNVSPRQTLSAKEDKGKISTCESLVVLRCRWGQNAETGCASQEISQSTLRKCNVNHWRASVIMKQNSDDRIYTQGERPLQMAMTTLISQEATP